MIFSKMGLTSTKLIKFHIKVCGVTKINQMNRAVSVLNNAAECNYNLQKFINNVYFHDTILL